MCNVDIEDVECESERQTDVGWLAYDQVGWDFDVHSFCQDGYADVLPKKPEDQEDHEVEG